MSRRSRAEVRKIEGDQKYGNPRIQKLINAVMRNGLKAKAQSIVYNAVHAVADAKKVDVVQMFSESIEKARPLVEVKSKRVGGATHKIPHALSIHRSFALAIRWIIKEARNEKVSNGMSSALANRFVEIIEARGPVMKKRNYLHREAEDNKSHLPTRGRLAFIHAGSYKSSTLYTLTNEYRYSFSEV